MARIKLSNLNNVSNKGSQSQQFLGTTHNKHTVRTNMTSPMRYRGEYTVPEPFPGAGTYFQSWFASDTQMPT